MGLYRCLHEFCVFYICSEEMWFTQPGDGRYIVCQTKPQINNDDSFFIIKFSLFAVFMHI